ncbi:MAG: PadR family transcriptional regulator [Firmicutes bacterium]|nr:PadR family transcriptional regulator [Bacillota bacterium]
MSQKYAVLGLLNAAPMTGYIIKKNFDYTIKKFWPVSYGGLYPALHKLTDEGYIQVHKQNTEGRGEISYIITDEGKKALNEWLLSKTSDIQCKDEYMLKIFVSKDLEDKDRVMIMKEYLYKKEEELKSILSLIEMRSSKDAIVTKGSSFIVDYTKEVLIKEIELLKKSLESEE